MSLLVSSEIYNTICTELKGASDSVQIISAYCKKNALQNLMNQISANVVEKKLMVRFRLDDLLKGSTDFEILEMCMKAGWKIYVRFDLHAKTYIIDNKRGIVGSANATTKGMLGKGGNYEIATLDDINESDIQKINLLYSDAILVDELLYEKFKIQFFSNERQIKNDKKTWDAEITNLFNPKIDTLFSHEFPDINNIEKGDYIEFLDLKYDGNVEEIRETFRWSTAYLWLLQILKENNGMLYFGTVSQKLHNALISDPKPYRRDVKIMLNNLLNLIEKLEMKEIVVDRPNYSRRIKLV